MKTAFLSRRDLVIEGLRGIDGFEVNVPKGAFYIFPDVSALFGKSHAGHTIQSGQDLAMYLLGNSRRRHRRWGRLWLPQLHPHQLCRIR